MSKAIVGVIRGNSSLKEIESKKHNIYIGVSLGNKWFTEENIKQQILWCLKYSKDKVGILVADTLHAINYEVRNGYKRDKALTKAKEKGDEMCVVIKNIILELSKKEQSKIEIIRWDDTQKDESNKLILSMLYNQFETNIKFKEKIMDIVKTFISKEQREFNNKKILSMCKYIIEELPILLNGFEKGSQCYDAHTYPNEGVLERFIEKIQKKQAFPEISSLLTRDCTFIELKVE